MRDGHGAVVNNGPGKGHPTGGCSPYRGALRRGQINPPVTPEPRTGSEPSQHFASHRRLTAASRQYQCD